MRDGAARGMKAARDDVGVYGYGGVRVKGLAKQ